MVWTTMWHHLGALCWHAMLTACHVYKSCLFFIYLHVTGYQRWTRERNIHWPLDDYKQHPVLSFLLKILLQKTSSGFNWSILLCWFNQFYHRGFQVGLWLLKLQPYQHKLSFYSFVELTALAPSFGQLLHLSPHASARANVTAVAGGDADHSTIRALASWIAISVIEDL